MPRNVIPWQRAFFRQFCCGSWGLPPTPLTFQKECFEVSDKLLEEFRKFEKFKTPVGFQGECKGGMNATGAPPPSSIGKFMDLEMEDADVNAVLGLGDFDPELELVITQTRQRTNIHKQVRKQTNNVRSHIFKGSMHTNKHVRVEILSVHKRLCTFTENSSRTTRRISGLFVCLYSAQRLVRRKSGRHFMRP